MAGKIALSFLVAVTIAAAPFSVAARWACGGSGAANVMACDSNCCADMSCCASSHHKTAPVPPPLAKAPDGSEPFVAVKAASSLAVADVHFQSARLALPATAVSAHTPSVLTLSCALLI
jgi:hypothetical protein